MSLRYLMMGGSSGGSSGGGIAEFTLTADNVKVGFWRVVGYDSIKASGATFGSVSSGVYTYNGTEYTVQYFYNITSGSSGTNINFGLSDGQIVKFSVDGVVYTITHGDSSTYPRITLEEDTTYTIKILSIS